MTPKPGVTMDATTQVSTMSHVVLGVPDLGPATAFWETSAALQVVERLDNAATLATHDGRIAVVLIASDAPGLHRLAFEVADATALEAFAQRLEARGITVERCTDEWVGELAIYFTDPDGFPWSLVVRPERDLDDVADTPVLKVLHPLLRVSDLKAAEDFLTSVMGFLPSDYVGDVTTFMRCGDAYHHSMAVTRSGEAGTIDHVCFHLLDLDTIMRARNRVRRHSEAEVTEVFRHGGSNSITFYFIDPHSGVQIEYCAQHRQVHDPEHEPRQLEASATTFDRWQDLDID